jgi:uncharacterized membrane protein YagU involved in acid resistance
MKKNGQDNNTLKGLAAGIVGGLVATFVMTQFQTTVTKLAAAANGPEEKKEEGENATVKAAEAISETFFDHKLAKTEKQPAGNAVHYGFGTTMGALYGLTAEALPAASIGYGLPFGTMLFLSADEAAVPAFGLSKPPTETPLSKHAYGLAAHLVYGLTTDLVRRGVRNIL